MGTPKIKKSVDNLENKEFQVHYNAFDLLMHGKTPKYGDRFKSWARATQGEHLNNLIDALLSAVAYKTITSTQGQAEKSVDFRRGQADGIILMGEWIKTYASETKTINEEEED